MCVVVLALLGVILVTPAHAQVHVDIGIQLPAPPQLVIVPEVRAVHGEEEGKGAGKGHGQGK